MTEQEWLTATDPTEMLKAHPGKFSERKLRLFALACCERIRRFITDPRSVAALELVWKHVETTPNRKPGRPKVEKGARAAHTEAYNRYFIIADTVEKHRQLIRSGAANAALDPLASSAEWAAEYAASFAAIAVGWEWVIENKPELLPNYSPDYREFEHRPQADLFRDIFGNPYQPNGTS